MSKQIVFTALALASGLALAGCSGSPQAEGQSPTTPPAASATASRADAATTTAETPGDEATAATGTPGDEATTATGAPEEEATAAPGAPGDAGQVPGSAGAPDPSAEVDMPGAMPDQNFTYEEAYAAWQNGMPYYDAFCLNYDPTTPAGISQCEGIELGTVDSITGEYIGG